jgi:hypothetical protein
MMTMLCLSLRTTQALALVAFAPQPLPHTVRRRVPVLQLPGTATADGTADEPQSSIDFEFEVRERVPPPYPEGLHEAAKADRAGPFWSTLGEPDDKSGIRPSYLRRDDWHISSTYTNDERAAMEAEEQEWIAAKDALSLGAVVKEDEWLDPDREREHIKFEKTLAQGAVSSKLPMPQSWQEYQFMQEQLAQNTVDVNQLSASILNLITHLVDFGFESSLESMKEIASRCVAILDGKTDVASKIDDGVMEFEPPSKRYEMTAMSPVVAFTLKIHIY